MNKSDLVAHVAVTTGASKRIAADTVDAVFEAVRRAVAQGDKVAIPGFGTFERRVRAPRTARNPRTGATIKVPATAVPVFRAGLDFREAVAGKRRRATR